MWTIFKSKYFIRIMCIKIYGFAAINFRKMFIFILELYDFNIFQLKNFNLRYSRF